MFQEENGNALTVSPGKKEQTPIPKTPKPSKQIETVEKPNEKVEPTPEIDFFDDVIDDTPTDDETIINSVHIDDNYDEDFEDAFEVHEKDDNSVQDSSEEDESESSLPRKKNDETEKENDTNYENGTFSSIRYKLYTLNCTCQTYSDKEKDIVSAFSVHYKLCSGFCKCYMYI